LNIRSINVIGSQTIVIQTSNTFAEFIIPYGNDYHAHVFAVNEQEIVSAFNFTAILVLQPGLPPESSIKGRG
jgi:hypothetical protein